MRDISQAYLNELGSVRRIGAKTTFRDKRLVFHPIAGGESNLPTLSHPQHWAAEPFGYAHEDQWAGILRVARNSDGKLCYHVIYDHDPDPPWDDWVVTSHDLLECKPGIYRMGSSQGMHILALMEFGGQPVISVFYWSPGGLNGPYEISPLKKATWGINGATYSDWVDNTGVAFAGISDEREGDWYPWSRTFKFAVQFFPYDTVRDNNHAIIQYWESNPSDQHDYQISEFPGAVYGDMQDPYRFDAILHNDIVHIFTSDSEYGRPVLLKGYTHWIAGSLYCDWSDALNLFPLDILDDTSYLKLGRVSDINNQIWITGRLKRGEDIDMDVYLYGDTNWSLGRDMFIANSDDLPDSGVGKLITLSNRPHTWYDTPEGRTWYIGHGIYAVADSTNLVGTDRLEKQTTTRDIHDVLLSNKLSKASTFSTSIKSDIVDDNIRLNSEITLDVGLQDDNDVWHWETLGVFGVDAITSDYHDTGQDRRIMSRGIGMKRLAQWTSDAFYDYWSQAKSVADPAELSELIRSSGQWETHHDMDEEPVKLDKLNEIGILYSSAKASRNGQMSAKFYLPEEYEYEEQIHSGRFGVGINYYRESRAQAAERLGKEKGDVTDGEFGDNGIFALVEPTRQQIVLYLVDDGTWYEMDSVSYTAPTNEWMWLKINHNEGLIEVYTGESNVIANMEVYWTSRMVHQYDSIPIQPYTMLQPEPWARDQRGRGALMVENVTAHSVGPGFGSKSLIIPVNDITVFPTSGRVIVDSELIDYDGKKGVEQPLRSMDLQWVEGKTWLNADHDNDLWTDVLVHHLPWNKGAPGEMKIGYNTYEVAYFQAISMPDEGYGKIRFDRVRFVVKRVGNPPFHLYAWLVSDDVDNHGFWPYWGPGREGAPTIPLISAPKSSSQVPTEFDWVEFDFTNTPEEGRWMWPGYGRGYYIVITCLRPGSYNGPNWGWTYQRNSSGISNSSNYYRLKVDNLHVGQTGTYIDWGWGQSWDVKKDRFVPYEAYGIGNMPSIGYEVYVQDIDNWDTSGDDPTAYLLPRDRGVLDNAALVVTEGPGKGMVFTITDYDWRAPSQWVSTRSYWPPDSVEDHIGDPEHGYWLASTSGRIFIDQKPYGSLGEGSKFAIYPALQVERTYTDNPVTPNIIETTGRGADNTTATAHPAGDVSVYSPLSVYVDESRFFSGEVDMSVESMARELVAKAGVMNFSADQEYDDTMVPWDTTSGSYNIVWMPEDRRHGILKFQPPDPGPSGNASGIVWRCANQSIDQIDDTGYVWEIYASGINDRFHRFGIKRAGEWEVAWLELVPIPLKARPEAWFTLSFQGESMSVWINDRHVHTFANDELTTGEKSGIHTRGPTSGPTVKWSALDMRVDNFVLDLGYRGTQLLSTLIGPKKIVYYDTQTGGIHMERMNILGDPEYTLTDLTVQASESQLDTMLVNRVRAEGAEIAEEINWESLREDGNLFMLVNATEANDLWETAKEADFILDDSKAASDVVILLAAADPRVEPNDIIRARSVDSFKDLTVEAVTFRMISTKEGASFDMNVEGRDAG